MDFEPQKFFIGLLDFFSILLPGALLTFLLKDNAGAYILGEARYSELVGPNAWLAFFFSSYLLGHIMFLLGSYLLDDYVYEWIRIATDDEQIRRLADGKRSSPGLARWLAARLIKPVSDKAVRQAERIRDYFLDPLGASSAVNAYQWCKARLTLGHTEALTTVQRFEADSKFFRSLLVVLFILVIWELILVIWGLIPVIWGHIPDIWGLKSQSAIALVGVLMLPLAFWRYVDQRVKTINQACWYIITLEGQRGNGYRQPIQAPVDGPSHAGGVVFKRVGEQVQYLLVQAKNCQQEWVLPKGHIKPGERMQEAAVREVHEETGVWALIKNELDGISFTVNGKPVKVQFYLMEAVEEEEPREQNRKHKWELLDKAVGRASHKESQKLLELAEQERTKT